MPAANQVGLDSPDSCSFPYTFKPGMLPSTVTTFCHRDTFGHSSVGKVGTGPVKNSGKWGREAHVGQTGEVTQGWPGAGAARHGHSADRAEGASGFAARLVSSLQGHEASKQVGVSAWESEALVLHFC